VLWHPTPPWPCRAAQIGESLVFIPHITAGSDNTNNVLALAIANGRRAGWFIAGSRSRLDDRVYVNVHNPATGIPRRREFIVIEASPTAPSLPKKSWRRRRAESDGDALNQAHGELARMPDRAQATHSRRRQVIALWSAPKSCRTARSRRSWSLIPAARCRCDRGVHGSAFFKVFALVTKIGATACTAYIGGCRRYRLREGCRSRSYVCQSKLILANRKAPSMIEGGEAEAAGKKVGYEVSEHIERLAHRRQPAGRACSILDDQFLDCPPQTGMAVWFDWPQLVDEPRKPPSRCLAPLDLDGVLADRWGARSSRRAACRLPRRWAWFPLPLCEATTELRFERGDKSGHRDDVVFGKLLEAISHSWAEDAILLT
jgi:hypothetical protein